MQEYSIIEIYEDNGEKYIHFIGTRYYNYGTGSYSFVFYTGFTEKLYMAVNYGIIRYETKYSQYISQSVADADTAHFDVNDIYYECDITKNTPCGLYMLQYKSMKIDIPIHKYLNSNNIARTLKVLEDNGIEKDECTTVLQAIGYTLLDAELFPSTEEGQNLFNWGITY